MEVPEELRVTDLRRFQIRTVRMTTSFLVTLTVFGPSLTPGDHNRLDMAHSSVSGIVASIHSSNESFVSETIHTSKRSPPSFIAFIASTTSS